MCKDFVLQSEKMEREFSHCRDDLSLFTNSLEFNHDDKNLIVEQKQSLTSSKLQLKVYENKDLFGYKIVTIK